MLGPVLSRSLSIKALGQSVGREVIFQIRKLKVRLRIGEVKEGGGIPAQLFALA